MVGRSVLSVGRSVLLVSVRSVVGRSVLSVGRTVPLVSVPSVVGPILRVGIRGRRSLRGRKRPSFRATSSSLILTGQSARVCGH